MDSILSRLIYSRIIYPDSKLAIYELSKKFIEQPDFDLHQIYRALNVLAKESDLIQSTVYENSIKITPRDTRVLFYDCTKSGEIAEKSTYSLDYEAIENESKYDGFYGVCTNMQDETCEIIKINKKRLEIEECFRIMKTEFKSRPVYLTDDDRIKAHFLTCYLALLIFRLLEKKLNNAFTCEQIIDAIREYSFLEISQKGYIPAYENSEIYSELHKQFGFYNDAEIVMYDQMNKIIKK